MSLEIDNTDLIKVTFQIEIKPPANQKKFDYKDLVSYLDNIEHIHEYALQVRNKESLSGLFYKKINDENRLKIENINIVDSFKCTISFFINLQNVFPYYITLKTLISICEKYGKDTKSLQETTSEIIFCVRKFIGDNPIIRRRIDSEGLEFIEDTETNTTIKTLIDLLNNPRFKRLYDFFCQSMISIRKIILLFEFINKQHEEILIDNEENNL